MLIVTVIDFPTTEMSIFWVPGGNLLYHHGVKRKLGGWQNSLWMTNEISHDNTAMQSYKQGHIHITYHCWIPLIPWNTILFFASLCKGRKWRGCWWWSYNVPLLLIVHNWVKSLLDVKYINIYIFITSWQSIQSICLINAVKVYLVSLKGWLMTCVVVLLILCTLVPYVIPLS